MLSPSQCGKTFVWREHNDTYDTLIPATVTMQDYYSEPVSKWKYWNGTEWDILYYTVYLLRKVITGCSNNKDVPKCLDKVVCLSNMYYPD